MASKTSADRAPRAKAEPVEIIDMAEMGARLVRRRAELGNPDMPRNAGNRRTASKKALLKAIEDVGGKW